MSEEPSENQYEFSLARRGDRAGNKKGFKVFLEIINVDDVIGLQEGVGSYPALEECFKDEMCRIRELQIFKVPLFYLKNGGYGIEDFPAGIICQRTCNGKLTVVEGKHRMAMARKLGIKHVLSRVQYQWPCPSKYGR